MAGVPISTTVEQEGCCTRRPWRGRLEPLDDVRRDSADGAEPQADGHDGARANEVVREDVIVQHLGEDGAPNGQPEQRPELSDEWVASRRGCHGKNPALELPCPPRPIQYEATGDVAHEVCTRGDVDTDADQDVEQHVRSLVNLECVPVVERGKDV